LTRGPDAYSVVGDRKLQEAAGGHPTIGVEGYISGELAGGIEIQFAPPPEEPAHSINLPILF
jgi:hypothetical protein